MLTTIPGRSSDIYAVKPGSNAAVRAAKERYARHCNVATWVAAAAGIVSMTAFSGSIAAMGTGSVREGVGLGIFTVVGGVIVGAIVFGFMFTLIRGRLNDSLRGLLVYAGGLYGYHIGDRATDEGHWEAAQVAQRAIETSSDITRLTGLPWETKEASLTPERKAEVQRMRDSVAADKEWVAFLLDPPLADASVAG